ncbi:FAD dependent oxidoreductase [Gloeophyllum trabeum ATCC 11539]|uniref:FAD dependent oxidoreductase n=1 Tax=Gloeophyllum trabeum (strain ATCC 11539 / FP-39264 / Madison 617) TaxID=670483 RepID=S7PVW9_GLOTA|nr:FAD dependent oxidoreductase [Gloeophyllum trabeum ATCC 11539]EPQ51781.1 FAD dependent oxidoreductase [Gloeophyllum trabeum ATCC 11539]
MAAQNREITIIGGGIVGCSTAYYLSHHPSYSPETTTITLLEASINGAAQGASGKAGGLVAKWAYPRELVDVSFEEHKRLAETHGGTERWGWRMVGCGTWEGRGEVLTEADEPGTGVGKGGERRSLEKTLGLDGGSKSKASRRAKGLPDDLTWVKESLTSSYTPMAPAGDTAQVHPYLFTMSMLELAKERGVQFVSGKVTSINHDGGQVKSVTYTEVTGEKLTRTIPSTHVILTAGAWSPNILPSLPISATRAHSITVITPPETEIAPYVLFTEIVMPADGRTRSKGRPEIVSPEIYPRPLPTKEIYICGPGDSLKLPETVDEVAVDPEACEAIYKQVASISPEVKSGTVDKRQACYLPVVRGGGGPIVGEVKSLKGLILGVGHTCWGICNAPGTARALSELVMEGGIKCADLRRLDPSRYFKL